MSISITRSTVHIPFDLAGSRCAVTAAVEDSINLETGDSIFLCSVSSIINEEDGQTIAPATLGKEEFRALVRAIQNKHAL